MHPMSMSLVVSQIMLIWLMITPASALWPHDFASMAGFMFLLAGLALALWAFVSMRRSNFSVMPEPVSGGELVERGPYRLIRHPMYAAIIIASVGALISHGGWIKLLYLCVLCAVLWIKLKREEQLLSMVYSGYPEYQQRTHALIPGVL